ncbi:peptidoglycan DD-metalloendopeptidase family protein [Roseibium sp. HPY-6]|uniref:murein hydrolase activator EnvC family protein n=1 Tax=Roseibium sp. HPY-6 TaxID=3229852 RepID=UPI00338F8490
MKPDRIRKVRPGFWKWRKTGPVPSFVALALILAPAPSLSSESLDEQPEAPVAETSEIDAFLERKKEREEELAALSRDIEVSSDRQDAIAREIRALDRDRETLNAKIISSSDTIKGLETELTDTERRLMSLGENEDAVRLSLIARRDILAEVLAALQRIGKRPPPALAVRPSDALSAVRSAILLNAVMPELKVETEALAADLEELQRLKSVIAEEKNRLRGDAMRLAEEKSRLELLLSAKRQEHLQSVQVLEEEKKRAAELAEQAGSLQELIANLEAEIESAQVAAEKSRQAALNAKRDASRNVDPFADPGRLAPEISFDEAKGRLPQPVAGTLLKDFGQEDEFGGLTEGQSIATRPGSNVTSPADGWVVYSGPFRSFGQLLILNTGDGYHVLLAGMDRIDAELGQFVLTGEPVGVMGATQWASASTFGLGSTQPILYVEFRKDGRAIDPTPWWERTEEEKARG